MMEPPFDPAECRECGHPVPDHYDDDGRPPPAPQLCHVWLGRSPVDPEGEYCPCSGGSIPP